MTFHAMDVVGMWSLADIAHKRLYVVRGSLREELDTTIGEVADVARDRRIGLREPQHCVAKANALDVAVEDDALGDEITSGHCVRRRARVRSRRALRRMKPVASA